MTGFNVDRERAGHDYLHLQVFPPATAHFQLERGTSGKTPSEGNKTRPPNHSRSGSTTSKSSLTVLTAPRTISTSIRLMIPYSLCNYHYYHTYFRSRHVHLQSAAASPPSQTGQCLKYINVLYRIIINCNCQYIQKARS